MADQSDQNPLPLAQFFNMMRVSHSGREFFIDLAQTSTEVGVAVLLGRFVTTPSHLKEMIKVLTDNLGKFEAKFGTVKSALDTVPQVKQ